MDMPPITLPPPIEVQPTLTPITPPPGSPDAQRRAGSADAPTARVVPPAPMETATLTFVEGQSRETTVPLDYPFIHDGGTISGVRIRRLTVGEVSQIMTGYTGKTLPDVFEVYARMTGLPAPILRGLDAADGLAVTERAASFLPRLMAEAYDLT